MGPTLVVPTSSAVQDPAETSKIGEEESDSRINIPSPRPLSKSGRMQHTLLTNQGYALEHLWTFSAFVYHHLKSGILFAWLPAVLSRTAFMFRLEGAEEPG